MSHTVYRVQDGDGRGPWKPGFSHLWVEDRPYHENLKPWLMQPKVVVCKACGEKFATEEPDYEIG